MYQELGKVQLGPPWHYKIWLWTFDPFCTTGKSLFGVVWCGLQGELSYISSHFQFLFNFEIGAELKFLILLPQCPRTLGCATMPS